MPNPHLPPTLLPAPCAHFWSRRVSSSRQTMWMGKGETTSLSYSAAFWKTKERLLIASLVSYKNQKRHESSVKVLSATSNAKSRNTWLQPIWKSQGNMASQKDVGNSPAAELSGVEYCHLTDKEFKIVLRNSASHRKTQKGNLVKS